MSEIDENQKIQKITRLLEKGGTMLANHHECGAPMFRYHGKILCPVCDYQDEKEKKQVIKQEIKTERKADTMKKVLEEGPIPEATSTEIALGKEMQKEKDQIAVLTRNKIHSIAASLENETDLQRVKNKMECIELGIRILKLLED